MAFWAKKQNPNSVLGYEVWCIPGKLGKSVIYVGISTWLWCWSGLNAFVNASPVYWSQDDERAGHSRVGNDKGTHLSQRALSCYFSSSPLDGAEDHWLPRPSRYLVLILPLVLFCLIFFDGSLDVIETGCDCVSDLTFQWHFHPCSEHLCMVKTVNPLQAWAGQGAGRPTELVAAQRGSVNGNSP